MKEMEEGVKSIKKNYVVGNAATVVEGIMHAGRQTRKILPDINTKWHWQRRIPKQWTYNQKDIRNY